MDAHTKSAPVLQLPEDILWNIFLMNSDMKEDDLELPRGSSKALTTTRFSSQVCQSWRNLILNSASIWGNLIDLDNIHGRGIRWGKEILKRAGDSTLSVQGFFRLKPKPEDQKLMYIFLQDLLSTKWGKIRSFRIVLGGWNTYASLIFDALIRPADSLESFDFSAPHDLTLKGELFAGRAPRLREYSCPAITLTWGEPWIRRLHEIQLPVDIDTTRAVGILRNMPLLEEVNIPELNLSAYPPHDSVTLPHLLQLHTSAHFDAILAILESIEAGPGCGLDLTIKFDGNELFKEELLLAAHSALSRYSTSYFSSKRAKYLELHLNDRWVFISDATLQNQDRRFAIGLLALRKKPLPSSIQSLCIGLFATPSLGQVTDFFLSYKMTRGLEKIKPKVVELITQLVSVTRLKIASDGVLQLLDTLEHSGITAFPSLRELVIIDIKTFTTNWEAKLEHFLTKRRERKAAVANLSIHFPSPPAPEKLKALHFLEHMTGMSVTFRTEDTYVEYICGSGSLVKLRLS